MNKQRLEQLFSGLLVLSFFLPWVDDGFISLSAMQYPGFVLGISGNGQAAFLYALYLIPVLAVAVILFSFQGKNTKVLSLVLGALSIVLGGYILYEGAFAFGSFIAILAGLGIVVTELKEDWEHYISISSVSNVFQPFQISNDYLDKGNDNLDKGFLGHPIGLRTLFLTEMWERMSYYGMRALLVLYMTGTITNFNPGLGWTQMESQAIYGIYVGMVYFMVVPGGWIADNILGHQKAVLYGAMIIALGHFTLAIPVEQTFFLGLIFVVLGTGLLKGNISTIVGKLYKEDDSRRESGYTIFYMAINIGSTLGFLVCSYLGEKIGWHWGFGAAGIGMSFGVLQFIFSKKLLGVAGINPNPMEDRRRAKLVLGTKVSLGVMFVVIASGLLGFYSIEPRVFAENFSYFLTVVAGLYFLYLFFFAGLTSAEKRNLLLLGLLFIGAAAFWSGFDQSASSLSIFARDYTDLSVSGYIIPVGWLQFANPIFVVIFAPIFAGIWTHLGRINLNPALPIKFALGLVLMAVSFVIMLFAVELAMETAPVGMRWLILTYLLQTWGELTLSPIGLAAFSRYSPKKYIGQMFGLWFLASAIGGVLAGLLGGDAMDAGLESISPVFNFMIKYYLAIALILIVLSRFIKRPDSPKSEDKEAAN